MNNLSKTILIGSIAVFSAGLLFVGSAQAQPPLVVEFQTTPLFNEADLLPGDSVTHWIKVTNNSGTNQKIEIQAINFTDPIPNDDLSRVLSIDIKQNGGTLYGPKLLSDFYQDGQIYLSDLANGSTVQYDLTVSFPTEKGNDWQVKITEFDILIGFHGEGGTFGVLGGGGGLPPGLTILDESMRVTMVGETSVTIIWTTSYFSTSQVIYGAAGEAHTLNLSDNTGIPPKYGYAHTTPEYNTSPKVTGHSVTIYGLDSGVTYYYRAVSHASLAVSIEHSFTTLGIKEIGEIGEEIPTKEIPPSGGELPSEEVVPVPGEEVEKPEEFITEGVVSPEEGIVTVPPEERAPGGGLASLLLASLVEIRETAWMAILVTICLLGLVAIGISEWELARKKKKNIS